MQERKHDFDALGTGLLGVSIAADHQAKWLMEERGIEFPLLVDPDGDLKAALGFGRMQLWRYLLPITWWKYLKGWRWSRPGAITGRPDELPGLVIVDQGGVLRYRYIGKTLGDYPSVDEVLAQLRSIVA